MAAIVYEFDIAIILLFRGPPGIIYYFNVSSIAMPTWKIIRPGLL